MFSTDFIFRQQENHVDNKQKPYKCDRLHDSWLTGITRPAGSCNLVTLSTNFAQYKNFVWLTTRNVRQDSGHYATKTTC